MTMTQPQAISPLGTGLLTSGHEADHEISQTSSEASCTHTPKLVRETPGEPREEEVGAEILERP